MFESEQTGASNWKVFVRKSLQKDPSFQSLSGADSFQSLSGAGTVPSWCRALASSVERTLVSCSGDFTFLSADSSGALAEGILVKT